jgi:hypothetical protein
LRGGKKVDEFVINESVEKQLQSLIDEIQPAIPNKNIKKVVYVFYKRVWEEFQKQGINDESLLVEKTILRLNTLFKKIKDKAQLLQMIGGGAQEFVGVFLAEGQARDTYSELIGEVDKVISTEGKDIALARGMIELEGDKIIYKDYRQFLGDRKNNFFGKRLDEIPPERRWRRKLFGIVKKEGGVYTPAIWYVWGDLNLNIPLLQPISFKATLFGEEKGFMKLVSRGIEFKVESSSKASGEDIVSLFRALKPFNLPFNKIREKYNEWSVTRSTTRMPGIIVSEADVWSIEETTNNFRLMLIDTKEENETTEPIVAWMKKEDLNFGEGSRIIFLSSMFEMERKVGSEIVKDVNLKIINCYPIDLITPNNQTFPPLPKVPEVKEEEEKVEGGEWL